MKKRGRPPKKNKQTPEQRAAYLREYNQRPEVIERRKVYNKRASDKRKLETSEEREERLAYMRLYRAQKRLEEIPTQRKSET